MEPSETGNLKGKVAVITGAARGMGRAISEGFLQRGAKVVATDRSWAGVEPISDSLSGGAGNLLIADMDVTSAEQMDATYQATIDRFGTVDILIGNAAMRSRDLFPPSGRAVTLDTKDSDWEKMFNVNVFGALKVIRRFVRPMLEKKRGSIVNVVSSGVIHHSHGGGYVALRPNSVEMPYMATKAALATLSFYLGSELKESNIAVNTVIPGHTRTTGFDEQNRARLAKGARPGPLPVVPEHVVPIVMHLAAQDAGGITGTMFDIMKWNIEHGLGGHTRWADRGFSYDALMASQ